MATVFFTKNNIDSAVCEKCEFFKFYPNRSENWVCYECKATGSSSAKVTEVSSPRQECDERAMVNKIDSETAAKMSSQGLVGKALAKAGGGVKKAVMLDVNAARRMADEGGLGLAVDALGLVAKGVGAAGKAIGKAIEKEKIESWKRHLQKMIDTVNNAEFNSQDETLDCVEKLLDVHSSLFFDSGSFKYDPDFRASIAEFTVNKLDTGVRYLVSFSDLKEGKLLSLQKKLLETKLNNLDIMEPKASYFRKELLRESTILESTTLEGSLKFILNDTNNLNQVLSAIFGLFGKAKSLKPIEKKELAEEALGKLETALGILRDLNYSPEKIQKFEAKFEKYKQKTAKIKIKTPMTLGGLLGKK